MLVEPEKPLVARHIQLALADGLRHFRVVLLHGPRQSGKTTIARNLAQELGGTYWTLEDKATRSALRDDPLSCLLRTGPVFIDEIQLGGDDLVRQIKIIVDDNRSPGQFFITGSTNFLTVPTLSESLAGRMGIYHLWPLSMTEIEDISGPQVHHWFDAPFGWDGDATTWETAPSRKEYFEWVCSGGYPEAMSLAARGRKQWQESYLATVVDRDIMALSRVRSSTAISRLMLWAAASTSQELNISKAANDLSLSRSVLMHYMEWVKSVGLIHQLDHWSRSHIARASKRPKLHWSDSGLAASMLGVTPEMLEPPTAVSAGPLLETFVVNEIVRQLAAANPLSPVSVRYSHFRPHGQGGEVDLVLERGDGNMVAIEIKATSTPQPHHMKHLRWLRDRMDRASPSSFKAGYLLHTGKSCLTISDRLHFRPIAALWRDISHQMPLLTDDTDYESSTQSGS